MNTYRVYYSDGTTCETEASSKVQAGHNARKGKRGPRLVRIELVED